MSDVMVILLPGCVEDAVKLQSSIWQLKRAGLVMLNVDKDMGVIEGICELKHVSEIRELPFVAAIRTEFNYIAEFPESGLGDINGPHAA